jgi:hypothetical protein
LQGNGGDVIHNASNGAGDFMTLSATNQIRRRTAAETRTDIGAVGGTGVSGQVSFWDGANSQTGDSGLVWDNSTKSLTVTNTEFSQYRLVSSRTSGNIGGIGAFRSNEVSARAEIRFETGGDISFVNGNGSFVGTIKWYILSTGILQSNGAQTIQTSTDNLTLATAGGNGHILLRPNGTGRVGIGTTSPRSILNIFENTASTGSSAGLTIQQSGTGDAIINFLLSGVRNWSFGVDNSDNDSFKLSPTDDVGIGDVFTVTTSGNVGIGTNSPTRLLNVNGAMRLNAIAEPTTGLNAGDMYYDSTSNRMRFRRASDWVDMGMLWAETQW